MFFLEFAVKPTTTKTAFSSINAIINQPHLFAFRTCFFVVNGEMILLFSSSFIFYSSLSLRRNLPRFKYNGESKRKNAQKCPKHVNFAVFLLFSPPRLVFKKVFFLCFYKWTKNDERWTKTRLKLLKKNLIVENRCTKIWTKSAHLSFNMNLDIL